MHRRFVVNQLRSYQHSWAQGLFNYSGFSAEREQSQATSFLSFVESYTKCFDRDHYSPGHMTGSALVTTATLDKVLLALHGKLNKWLQLGGHADGYPLIDNVAMREAEEESGLNDLRFFSYTKHLAPEWRQLVPGPVAFDIDCHEIPAHGAEPAHKHYDLRFLLIADAAAPLKISPESQALRWLTLPEARLLTSEPSMLRQFAKLDYLRELTRIP